MKITTISILSIALLALFISACGNAANTTANNQTATIANQSNTAVVINSNQAAVNNTVSSGNAANVSKNAATSSDQSKTNEIAPNAIVKNLYAEHEKGTSRVFKTKDRALLDKYFRKDLADLIWKDIVDSKNEVGVIDFDPLYGSQDPQIKDFVIMETGWGGDKKFGGENDAVVQVTFKDSGQEVMVSHQFERGKDKAWKIYDIHYRRNGDEVRLAELLRGAVKK